MRENRQVFPHKLRDGWAGPVLFGQAAERGVEAGVERLLQRLRREPRRLLPVVGQVDQSGDERARVRSAQRLLAVEVVEEITDCLLVERHALAVALVAQDAAEGFRRRIANADLVRHAAEEAFSNRLGGRKVGGKDDLAKERQLDLAARGGEAEA